MTVSLLSYSDLLEIESGLRSVDKVMVRLMYEVGATPKELVNLKKSHVNFEKQSVELHQNDETRVVGLTEGCLSYINQATENNSLDSLVIQDRGKDLTVESIYIRFSNIDEKVLSPNHLWQSSAWNLMKDIKFADESGFKEIAKTYGKPVDTIIRLYSILTSESLNVKEDLHRNNDDTKYHYTEQEIREIENELNSADKVLVRLIFDTGLNPYELNRLKGEQVNFEDNTIKLDLNGNSVVYVSEVCLDYIKESLNENKENSLILQGSYTGLSEEFIYVRLAKIKSIAGNDMLTFNCIWQSGVLKTLRNLESRGIVTDSTLKQIASDYNVAVDRIEYLYECETLLV